MYWIFSRIESIPKSHDVWSSIDDGSRDDVEIVEEVATRLWISVGRQVSRNFYRRCSCRAREDVCIFVAGDRLCGRKSGEGGGKRGESESNAWLVGGWSKAKTILSHRRPLLPANFSKIDRFWGSCKTISWYQPARLTRNW